MKIQVTAEMLFDLCEGYFTMEACKALCEYFNDLGDFDAPTVGDLTISFEECPAGETNLYDDSSLIAQLDNGNVLVVR